VSTKITLMKNKINSLDFSWESRILPWWVCKGCIRLWPTRLVLLEPIGLEWCEFGILLLFWAFLLDPQRQQLDLPGLIQEEGSNSHQKWPKERVLSRTLVSITLQDYGTHQHSRMNSRCKAIKEVVRLPKDCLFNIKKRQNARKNSGDSNRWHELHKIDSK